MVISYAIYLRLVNNLNRKLASPVRLILEDNYIVVLDNWLHIYLYDIAGFYKDLIMNSINVNTIYFYDKYLFSIDKKLKLNLSVIYNFLIITLITWYSLMTNF
jgi:hypothetical protein